MRIFLRSYILFCWAGAIFILIAWPMPEYEGTVTTYYDKAAHVFLFGILSGLIFLLLSEFKKIKIFFVLALSFLLSAAYSAFCEYVQAFAPGRDVSGYDFLAGILGSAIVLAFVYGNKRRKKT